MISENVESKLTFYESLAAFPIPLPHHSLSSSVNNELWDLILQMSHSEDIGINFCPLILSRYCRPCI